MASFSTSSSTSTTTPAPNPQNLCLAYEQRTLDALTKPFILPVTIITGHLGSGKTTLLKNLLAKKRNLRLATLINDLGGFNYDLELLQLASSSSSSSSSSKAHPHHPRGHAHTHTHTHSSNAADRMIDLHGDCLCCSHLTQDMRQNVWEILQTPDDTHTHTHQAAPQNRAVDYLVIETSGVTDPETIIKALDEKFGKMTRARLDSVVTVVDSDVLHAELTSPPSSSSSPSVARRHQLECADVILLNKIDLLEKEQEEQDKEQDTPTTHTRKDEKLNLVLHHLQGLNPLARIHQTRYADVPLQYVLDVELPEPGVLGQMTHETGTANYTTRGASTLRSRASQAVSEKGKTNLLTGQRAAAAEGGGGQGGEAHPHMVTDGLSSFTFESTHPFSLAKIQHFFSHLFPAEGVIRCKGFMHVRDLPGRRISLSMSGRRRFHVQDEGKWESTPKTQLVFIGKGASFEKEVLVRLLEEACEQEGGKKEEEEKGRDSVAVALAREIRSWIKQDKRMEMVDPRELLDSLVQDGGAKMDDDDGDGGDESLLLPPWVDALVAFRLTGARSLGVTAEHLSLQHGVDVNGLNRDLQERINMAGKPQRLLLHSFSLADDEVVLCFAAGSGEGQEYFATMWAWIAEAAGSVIKEKMSHLKLCKCGH